MHEAVVRLLIAVVALAVGVVLAWLFVPIPRPLSERAMRRRRVTLCPLCEGAGCINDITASHGAPRIHEEQPPAGVL